MPEQTASATKQFTITRVFDAPRDLVWQAWTDPDEAAIWWHPRGIITPRESVDLDVRPGGRYRYTMIAPDGTEYPTAGVYREITPPERLVMTWGSPDDPDETAPVLTIELAEHGERGEQTRMTFHVLGVDGAPGDENVYDGWDSAFDLLVEHLDDSGRE
ncbi:SRPBCC domain-containing protein [Agromyces sp. Leaf222]|uniref:SRPBCC family protein n=1 Tax=Agromyces sp. Leaf222 TaxID=1735688 RepID=UPI0006FB41DB|nr:SRPBCC domain-containing protein [Agromyces sp. Leaf222]KQM81005.1 polyketide cyclase [Agromyces sp. Leaf222]